MRIAPTSAVALLALCPFIASAQTWHAPLPGSAERSQVLSALRSELARFDPDAGSLRFVVRELCLSDKTGWVMTEPRSADGANRYEPLSAWLRKRNGRWAVAGLACTEEECAAGTTPEEIRRRLHPTCG